MKRPLIINLLIVAVWLLVGLSLSGVNYCQKSYEFGAQSTVEETPTPSPTPTPDTGDDDDDDDDDSVVPSPTPTPDTDPTETPTASPTQTPTPESSALLRALGELGEKDENSAIQDNSGNTDSSADASARASQSQPSNWLGQAFVDERDSTADSDSDGFADWLEEQEGSLANDKNSYPDIAGTNLRARMLGVDDDYDGLSNSDERARGTDPNQRDSDDDGVLDGAEVLSGSNPLEFDDTPLDADSDGLSDEVEKKYNSNPRSSDSDQDRLSDDMEIFLGTNPLNPDSDSDGILDGKEVEIGSDPAEAD